MITKQARFIFILALLSAGFMSAGEFPEPYDSEPDQKTPRLSPKEAADQFKVPEGFHVTLFAGEPDIRNPIGMTWDSRGRLWVAENYTYAERTKNTTATCATACSFLKTPTATGISISARCSTTSFRF